MRRRDFLTSAAAGWALAPGWLSWRSTRRRTDDLRLAVVGVRSRGWGHVQEFQRLPGVDVVALVDVDDDVRDRRLAELAALKERGGDHAGAPAGGERDLRRVLERDDIHAVSLATPNHLHALQAIWCCQAGKAVYVEKPVSHTVFEGAQLVAAARRHGVVVQAGTQSRSSAGIAEGIAQLAAGRLGAVRHAHAICYKPRRSIGRVDGPWMPPETVDYDLYCGPTPLAPLTRKQLHYDWHWQSVTGNGDLGNQGIHQMDTARWAVEAAAGPPPAGRSRLPRRVRSIGGRFGYVDDGDTPNTQAVVLEGHGAPILFEVRGLPRDAAAQRDGWNGAMDRREGWSIATTVHCEGGKLVIPNTNRESILLSPDGEELERFVEVTSHFAAFIEAVRANDPGRVAASIEEGHLSSALCHLGGISHALGRPAGVDELQALDEQTFPARAAGRLVEHLRANEVALDGQAITLGAAVELDPSGAPTDEAVAALWHRDDRAPFVVPDLGG